MKMEEVGDLDLENWMGQLPSFTHKFPMTVLAIPGSHDSFSSTMTTNSDIAPDDASQSCFGMIRRCSGLGPVKKTIYKWSLTQDLQCGSQLNTGIRYFDFRVASKQGTRAVYAVHGLYGDQVTEILEEMNRFLDGHPKEVLLLDFSHFYNFTDEDHDQLVQSFNSVFGPKLQSFTTSLEQLSLSRLWAVGHQVLIVYRSDRPKALRNVWPDRWMPSPWPQTTDPNRMIGFLDENLRKGRDTKLFHVSQGVLTPTTGYIFWRSCGSLRETLVPLANKAVQKWLPRQILGPNGVNVVMADFIEAKGFVNTIVSMNHRAANFNFSP